MCYNKNMKKLLMKKFEIKNNKKSCKNCGKKEDALSSIRMTATDINRRYRYSGHPMLHVYSAKLCKKCFKSFLKKFEEITL